MPVRPASAPASRASSLPRNLDHALESLLTVDAQAMPLGTFTDLLRQKTQTNLAVNWNALAQAGVTRDTPVTLHLKELSYEQVVRTLMEVLPTTGTMANYTVGENTLAISTNRQIGQENAAHLYDLARSISYSFDTPVTQADQERNLRILAAVLKAELERAGEPLDAPGHDLSVKGGMLLATVSARGQGIITRMVNLFNQPIKAGQLAMGTQLTVSSKKTRDAYMAFLAMPEAGAADLEQWHRAVPEMLAKNPQKYPQFNIALVPGTSQELGKETPDLATAITDGGVLLVGPGPALRARTVLVVYDLRDVMKKIAARSKIKPAPQPADVQQAILQVVRTTVKPEGQEWGGGDDLGQKPAIMIPYNGLMIVFATAETQRAVAGALQGMNK